MQDLDSALHVHCRIFICTLLTMAICMQDLDFALCAHCRIFIRALLTMAICMQDLDSAMLYALLRLRGEATVKRKHL